MLSVLTYQNRLWTRHAGLMQKILFVLGGVTLLTIAAQIYIPWHPVPLTFQSTTVVLIGMMFGPRYGAYVVATYLFAGLCGLPVFAEFSSSAEFLGSTAGYLIGFFPAVIIAGYLAQLGFAKNFLYSFIAAVISASVIFFFGLLKLSYLFGWHQALIFGLYPFAMTEIVKLIAVAAVAPYCWKNPHA